MNNHAINPLDGRYFDKTRTLAPFFSEQALMKYRVMMEVEYLIALSALHKTALRKFTLNEEKIIRNLYENFKKLKLSPDFNLEHQCLRLQLCLGGRCRSRPDYT